MNIYNFLLYFFMILSALAAVSILFITNVFKAALLLLVSLLCVAALFIFSFAEFVAVTQILIYAGGVIILIIFGVMLTSKISGESLKVENNHIFSGLLVSGGLLALLINAFAKVFNKPVQSSISANTISETGINLMSSYVLPFELAGILLLVALVGAAVTATIDKKKDI